MDLSKEEPSKNVSEHSAYGRALAEYWWHKTNERRQKSGKPPLDPQKSHKAGSRDPVLLDPFIKENVEDYMRQQPWYNQEE
jgi:hypothetical protein